MEAHFIVNQEKGSPKKFRLADNEYVILGRNADKCQVHLNDDLSSSTHCKISMHGNAVFVEDLDSKNGIYLNGVRVLKQRIYIGDKIKFGRTSLYLNPKRMSEKDVTLCSYRGRTEQREIGEVTLELVVTTPADALPQPKISQTRTYQSTIAKAKNLKTVPLDETSKPTKPSRQKPQKVYKPQREKDESSPPEKGKPISRIRLNTLKYFANLIDLSMMVICSMALLEIVKLNYPHIQALGDKSHYIRFLIHSKVLPYTLSCFFIAGLLYRLNRGLEKGSLGERILKINSIDYK